MVAVDWERRGLNTSSSNLVMLLPPRLMVVPLKSPEMMVRIRLNLDANQKKYGKHRNLFRISGGALEAPLSILKETEP